MILLIERESSTYFVTPHSTSTIVSALHKVGVSLAQHLCPTQSLPSLRILRRYRDQDYFCWACDHRGVVHVNFSESNRAVYPKKKKKKLSMKVVVGSADSRFRCIGTSCGIYGAVFA